MRSPHLPSLLRVCRSLCLSCLHRACPRPLSGVWRRHLGGIDAVGCRGCARWVRAGSAGCLRLRASRADVVGMLRFGCPPRRVSPRSCVVLGSLEARSGWEAYACDRMWACWARAGRAARFRGRVPRVSARKGRDGSRHHCCATFGRVDIRRCARSELGSTYELEHDCGLCEHLSTHTR